MIGQGLVNKVWGAFNKPDFQMTPEAMEIVRSAARDLQPLVQAYGGYNLNGSPFAYDGEKFPGGFGGTYVGRENDYYYLRERSSMLFQENPYACGVVRRLVTNEINTGLNLEAIPNQRILGLSEDDAFQWSETVEDFYKIWCDNPLSVDYHHERTMAEIERVVRMDSLIDGDILVVLRQDGKTKLPKIQLVSGSLVVNPLGADSEIRDGHTVKYGVEFDARDRQVAFWVNQKDGTIKRVPAYGSRSRRRIAWLVYGTERRAGECRGVPLLGIILQSLRELDRYRDSTQRKALINSMLAMFIQNSAGKPSSVPWTQGKLSSSRLKNTTPDASLPDKELFKMIPGLVMQRLQEGEEPKFFAANGQGEEFGNFESAIVNALSWCLEIPPTILKLAFSANFAASQAEINEFKLYLKKRHQINSTALNIPTYNEWLVSQILQGTLIAPGFIEGLVNPNDLYTVPSWLSSDWSGAIKVSADTVKQANGAKLQLEIGATTHNLVAREISGTKFSRNMLERKRANKLWIEAEREKLEFLKEMNAPEEPPEDSEDEPEPPQQNEE